MNGVLRIVPKIDLTGFEHRVIERKIRLRNGVLDEANPPAEDGRPQVALKPATSPALIQEAIRAEQKRLQGTWKATTGALSGRPGGVEADVRWTISGDRIVLEFNGRWEGTYRLDPAASPKRLNLILKSPDGKRTEELRATYEVRGDDLCICLASGDDARPEGLRSSSGTGQVSFGLKRERL